MNATPDDDTPTPALISLDDAIDADALAAFFTQLTGRSPTPDEIAEARAYIDAHIKQ